MVDRDTIISLLKDWGRWQRTVRNPTLTYSTSQYETPLQKKRNVRPVYLCDRSEQMEKIILKYLPKKDAEILELTYVELKINAVSAATMNCSVKTYTNKRNELIGMLQGIYTVMRDFGEV